MNNKTTNPIALKMRQMYCLAGAQLVAPELKSGWEEIERLEAELSAAKKLSKMQGKQLELCAKSKWISVSEKLPNDREQVWAYEGNLKECRKVVKAEYTLDVYSYQGGSGGGEGFFTGHYRDNHGDSPIMYKGISHWQPYGKPSPPSS